MAQSFLHLKQKTTIWEYVSEFNKFLCYMTGWPDEALMAAFLCGLKDDTAIKRCSPANLRKAMAIALNSEKLVKNPYTEKKSKKQNKWYNGHRNKYYNRVKYSARSDNNRSHRASSALTKNPDALGVDVMAVKDKRKRCFYCHKKGHITRNCPELPKKQAGRQWDP